MSGLSVWGLRSELATMEDLNANSDFKEFERVRRLVNSCVSLQITSLFIEEMF